MHKSIDGMKKTMEAIFAECEALRGAGQKEYAGGDNAFGNFTRLADQLGMTPEKVLWVYMVKHIDGIRAWINGHTSQREPVRGRIKDAIVYLCLLAGMVEERELDKPQPMMENLDGNKRRQVECVNASCMAKWIQALPIGSTWTPHLCPRCGHNIHSVIHE